MDFNNYRFRASQCHKLLVGNIGLSDSEKDELATKVARKMAHATGQLDDKGKPVKALTPIMLARVDELIEKQKSKALPLTMETELIKIFRSEKYRRNFSFTNKYVQKGIQQEEKAITLYMKYLNEKGLRTFFTKNSQRLENDWFSGEPDVVDNKDILKTEKGVDVKASWTLDSFPVVYPDPLDERNKLDQQYESQNQVYMDLTGAKKWVTAYTLVNSTEHQLQNEKLKWFYACDQPDDGDKYFDDYIKKIRECEIKMIYDYESFVKSFPGHIMEISKDEWFGEGYDMPLEARVLEKKSVYDPEFISTLKNRIIIARNYMNELNAHN